MRNISLLRTFPHRYILTVLVVSMSALVGCQDRVALSEEKMASIRNSPSQPIDPPPQPEKVEDFVYSAEKERSPFVAPSLLNPEVDKAKEDSGIQPDLTREKDPLEEFELSTLTFRGIVVAPSGEQFGLIQRPDGTVSSVKVGDYLGQNDGRIVEITPTQINLIEIVPDSRFGFVEKPESLVSPVS